MIRQHNKLIGLHFYNSAGWHEVKAEVSTGCFLVESTSRKGCHVTQKIWRALEIAPYHLFQNESEMHQAELAVGK
jgi:hypothetical protein